MDLYKLKTFFTKTKTGLIPKWKWKLYLIINKFEHWFNFNFKLKRNIGLFFWWLEWIVIKGIPKEIKEYRIRKTFSDTKNKIPLSWKIKNFCFYLWKIRFSNWI